MEWITEEQVKEAAKQGVIPALRCSLEHHQQGRDAPLFELIKAFRNNEFIADGCYCACCCRTDMSSGTVVPCRDCPLWNDTDGNHCCNGLWIETLHTLDVFVNDYSNANYEAFKKAESDVCNYIEEVLATEIAKEEAEK